MERKLAKLQANKARRQKRQSKKGGQQIDGDGEDAMSPDGDAPTPGRGGKQQQTTQRKCANCGQVGHIKTNKKSVMAEAKCSRCNLPVGRVVGSTFTGGMPASFS